VNADVEARAAAGIQQISIGNPMQG
jgi:hypothetical protein